MKAVGIAGMLALTACGGSGNGNTCHNLPVANGLLGQTSYSSSLPNANGGAPSPTTLSGPTGSAASDGTHFYVVDAGNQRILGYNSVPTAIDQPADFVVGQSNLTSNTSGPANLSGPQKVSIAVDGISSDQSILVVTDTRNNRVLIYSPLPTASGATPTAVIGQGSLTTNTSSYGCTGGAVACATSLYNPTGAMIGGGKLVIVDQNNNRALVYNSIPTTNGAAADVVLGQVDFASRGSGYYNTTTPSNPYVMFNQPTDVWTDGGSLYISDSQNNRVLFWNQIPQSNNTTATNVLGQTLFTTTSSATSSIKLSNPTSVFYDSNSAFLFVADTGNNRVLKFQAVSGNGDTASGVYGQATFSGYAYNDDDQNDQPGDQQNNQSNTNSTQNTLYQPSGVFAINGKVWVADKSNNRVVSFNITSSVDGSNANACQ